MLDVAALVLPLPGVNALGVAADLLRFQQSLLRLVDLLSKRTRDVKDV